MRKQDMVCWKCTSFERNIQGCKLNPGKAVDIEDPRTEWCGSGSWKDPYDSLNLLYHGQWKILEESVADAFRDAWRGLLLAADKNDDWYMASWSRIVLSRSDALTGEEIVEALGEEEAKKYFAWKDNLFAEASRLNFKKISEEAKEYELHC